MKDLLMTKLRRNDDPTLEDFEPLLKIDKDNLDEAIQQQPDLFYRVSMIVALWVSRRDTAKQNVATIEADVAYEMRTRCAAADKKITEAGVVETQRRDPSLQKANKDLIEINYQLQQWTAMKEAIGQRGFAMRELVELYVSNYYVASGIKGADEAREIDADRARLAMAEARRNSTSRKVR